MIHINARVSYERESTEYLTVVIKARGDHIISPLVAYRRRVVVSVFTKNTYGFASRPLDGERKLEKINQPRFDLR
jgi:hypothetical protein